MVGACGVSVIGLLDEAMLDSAAASRNGKRDEAADRQR
jgi:hypothetical protein